jgi:hypothetical protein
MEFESVWLWRVDTPNRTIYLAGEIHDHLLAPGERLSHKLAYAAYESSSRVLLEGGNSLRTYRDKELKGRLTPETWTALSQAVGSAVTRELQAITGLTDAQRNQANDAHIDTVNRLTDFALYLGLSGLLASPPEQLGLWRSEAGFLKKIAKEQGHGNFRKIGFLELKNNAIRVWSDQCGEPDKTELLVKRILAFSKLPFSYSLQLKQDLSLAFKNPLTSDYAITQTLQTFPLQDVESTCTVRPRNLQWIEKIQQELVLDRSDKPLMIVAGLSHIVGETGLLELLCKQGYCKAQRVFQVD